MIYLFKVIINLYRFMLSPYLGKECRFLPSCSEYALEALDRYGYAGCWLAFKRIMRCNPCGGHGFDPVPMKNDEKCV